MDLGHPVQCFGSGIPPALRFLELIPQGAVIDAPRQPLLPQSAVHMLLPGLTPDPDVLPRVPFPGLDWIQPQACGPAERQHHVGMEVSWIVPLFYDRVMECQIRHHPPRHKLLANEQSHQLQTLKVGELMRQRHVDLPRQLGIWPGLHALDGVPERRTILQPVRRVLRRQDFAVGDTAPVSIAGCRTRSFADQVLSRPVCRSRHGIVGALPLRSILVAPALPATKDLHTEMIDRHRRGLDIVSAWSPLRWRTYVSPECISALLRFFLFSCLHHWSIFAILAQGCVATASLAAATKSSAPAAEWLGSGLAGKCMHPRKNSPPGGKPPVPPSSD
jgi:hypothetical protein